MRIFLLSIVLAFNSLALAADSYSPTSLVKDAAASEQFIQDQEKKITKEKEEAIEKTLAIHDSLTAKLLNGIKLDKLSIGFKVGDSVRVTDGLEVGLKYKFKVSPAYFGKYFSRMDSYKLEMPVSPIKLFFKKVTPWFFDATPSAEINFWQLFDKGADARKITNGYTPLNFPLTAEKAINKLKVGDMAQFRGRMNVNIGYSKELDLATSGIGNQFEVRGAVSYVIQGLFDIYVFKAENNVVRLRLVARRDRGLNGELSFGVNDSFKIFAVKIVDKAIVRLLELDKLAYQKYMRNKQNIFLGDYTLDMNNDAVQEAYNELFDNTLQLKGVKFADIPLLNLTNPFKDNEKLRELLVSNLEGLNAIYHQDMAMGDEAPRRVIRNFQGSNSTDNTFVSENRLGIRGLLQSKKTTTRRDNKMTITTMLPDYTDGSDYYFFPTWSHYKDGNGLLTYLKEDQTRSSYMIYVTNNKFELTAFKAFGFQFDFTDKVYYINEHNNGTLRHFDEVLPLEMSTALRKFLADRALNPLTENLRNIRLTSRYYINQNGLTAIENRFAGKDSGDIIEIIKQVTLEHLQNLDGNKSKNKLSRSVEKDIAEITENLLSALDKNLNPNERHKHVAELVNNALFLRIGPAILLGLVPLEELPASTHFEFKLYKGSDTPITFVYPEGQDYQESEFYESITDVQRLMDDVVPDMRLNSTYDSKTTRKTKNEKP